jgi:flagellar protein FlgJ
MANLRAAATRGEPGALKEVAQQFEALFIGMMLKSARAATPGDGLTDGAGVRQYLDLMDQQVAMEMARRGGLGFADLIVNDIDGTSAATGASLRPLEAPSPAEFVQSILPHARAAAIELGVPARVIVAQAALETGWGKSMAAMRGESNMNLFGIKAGQGWQGPRLGRSTLEFSDGLTERRLEQFRAYPDMAASFEDYVQLMRSPHYAAALECEGDADSYINAVSSAGYATDPKYAEKWSAVLYGDTLESAAAQLKLDQSRPTH